MVSSREPFRKAVLTSHLPYLIIICGRYGYKNTNGLKYGHKRKDFFIVNPFSLCVTHSYKPSFIGLYLPFYISFLLVNPFTLYGFHHFSGRLLLSLTLVGLSLSVIGLFTLSILICSDEWRTYQSLLEELLEAGNMILMRGGALHLTFVGL